MYNVTFIQNEKKYTASADKAIILSELINQSGLYIDRPCNGKGLCGKCKVHFDSGIPLPNNFDIKFLSKKELDDGYRISCKCLIENDAVVLLPAQLNNQIIKSGIENENKISLSDLNTKGKFGLAVDIGTTTIVAYLVSLKNGEVVSAKSSINEQRKYGDNVISRCEFVTDNENGLEILKNTVLDNINSLVSQLCNENKMEHENIIRATFAGNTIMQHILLGVDPTNIAVAPFTPVFTEQKILEAEQLGVNINKKAKCYITTSISGYVGGDTVSAIKAVNMDETDEISLLIDIGTNGEIALGNKNGIVACSAAAGPAFEGSHIKFGTASVEGAINKAYLDNKKMHIETINNANAVGICGSGLLDIIALVIETGAIDETGAFNQDKVNIVDDESVFFITDNIYVTQKDIREVQLAKAAIAAGINVLINESGVGYDDIKNVYLAGGFGSFMDINSAIKIGLLPKQFTNKTVSVGNASGMGAIKMLLSDEEIKNSCKIPAITEYIELSLNQEFNNLFIDHMMF